MDSDLEIPCGVTGTRPFTWTWKKFKIENWSTLEHDITSSDFEYTISSDGTLTSDRPSDGFYQCFVTNSVGTTFSRKIRVKISSKYACNSHYHKNNNIIIIIIYIIYLFIHLFSYLFIYLCLFIYLFIYLFSIGTLLDIY